ncbi:hypothetical protein [Actinoallomurus sp. CA-150999]
MVHPGRARRGPRRLTALTYALTTLAVNAATFLCCALIVWAGVR